MFFVAGCENDNSVTELGYHGNYQVKEKGTDFSGATPQPHSKLNTHSVWATLQ